MFRTKNDVNKHAEDIFRNIKTEKERNLRCLSIGQQYINVGDYETANKYLNLYLSVKDDSSVGHKLLGQCYEHFSEKEKALNSYKYSLELDSKQPELILKVCELLGDSTIVVDKAEARFWLEKGELRFPYHKTMFNLKQKLNSLSDSKHPESVESSIISELKSKPKDPALHCRLLSFYIDNKRINEAYNEAFVKDILFVPTLHWYQCAVQICKSYRTQFPNAINGQFYANYLFAVERSLALSIQDVKMHRKSIPECVLSLAKFDEILSAAASLNNKSDGFRSMVSHMSGQLCFHTANILYRKIKWDDNNAQEIFQCICPLLLLSTSANFDVFNFKKQDPFLTRILIQCSLQSTYRLSQAGFVLLALAKNSQKYFMEKVFNFCVADWREKILQKIYRTSDSYKTSFFVNCSVFSEIPQEFPINLPAKIERFLAVTEDIQPTSLHHLVWLGLQYLMTSDKKTILDMVLPAQFYSKSFHTLQFSQNHELSCFAETLCKLDVDAFLYACIYCAESAQIQSADTKFGSPQILPADVSKVLCSPEHDLWWESAHQMSAQNIPEENFSKVRSSLQRGIEAVRLMGNNDLPLPLLVLLARTFSVRAVAEPSAVNAAALESRSLLYWRAAVTHLNEIVRDEAYTYPYKTMFNYSGKPIKKIEALKLLEQICGVHRVEENNSTILDESASDIMIAPNLIQNVSPHSSFIENKLIQNLAEPNPIVMYKLERLIRKVESITLNSNAEDDALLYNLIEENKKLSVKLELVSSHVMQVFQMVTLLTKRIDQWREASLDSVTQGLQAPGYQQNLSSQQNTHRLYDPFTSGVAASPVLNSRVLGNETQTNFQLRHTTVPVTTSSSYLMNTFQMQMPSLSSFMPTSNLFSQNYLMNSQPMVFAQPTSSTNSFANSFFPAPTVVTASPVCQPMVFAQPTSNTNSFANSFFPEATVVPVPASPVCNADINFFSSNILNSSVVSSPELTARMSETTMTTTPVKSSLFGSLDSTPLSISHSLQISASDISSIRQTHSVKVPEEVEGSEDEVEKEHDPIPNFKPIIPLPDEVAVTTGEEDEDILFESRAKLYRFVDKEWKERGIGRLKVLKNSATGRVRVLMRREVVHKICANHLLASTMTLQELSSCDKAWVYSALDYSDEKMEMQKFCVKFKTQKIAKEFEKVFIENKNANEITSPMKAMKNEEVGLALSTPISNVSPMIEKKKIEETKPHFDGFTFTSKPIISQSPPTAYENKIEEKPKTPFGSLSFNMGSLPKSETAAKLFSSTTTLSETAKPQETSPLPFASVKDTIDFSCLSKVTSANAFAKSDHFKGFAGAGSLVFGSAVSSDAPSAVSTILKAASGPPPTTVTTSSSTAERTKIDGEDEFIPTAEFEPVIPLPDIVHVKTGEEGLEVVYEERCKLFRYVGSEWKERGIGNMKILKDSKDNSFRLLMRREQVHKVCCNQRLTRDLELIPINTSNKAWTWKGQDFSEGELTSELFCVRFKTVEQAEAFKRTIENIQKDLASTPLKQAPSEASKSNTENAIPKLSEICKRKEDSWDCESCYVNNLATSNECVACKTLKDGTVPSQPTGFSTSPSAFSTISDKSKSYTTFGVEAGSKPCEMKFGVETKAEATSATTSASIAVSTFSFGAATTSSIFSFGTSVPTTTTQIFTFGKTDFNSKPVSGGHLFGNPTTTSESKLNETATSKPTSFTGNNLFTGTLTAENVTPPAFGHNTSAFSSFSFKIPGNDGLKSPVIFGAVEGDKYKKDGDQKSSSDEPEFVSETQISEEDKKKAESLMLPSNFYAYRLREDCKGCIGCDPEDLKNKPKSDDKHENYSSETSKSYSTLDNISNRTSNALKWSVNSGFVFGKDSNTGGTFNIKNVFNREKAAPTRVAEDEDVGSDEDSVVPSETDPHFDPIIPLPDIVETRTGEEEETTLFCNRAKLYRFDAAKKEWKERGVGDLKVLHHPSQRSYRLLLRRDQVHKVVLNQRFSSTMNLERMSTCKNSWCWYGMNLTEENHEPVLENLAIRFKTEETTDQFHNIVNDCISNLDSAGAIEETVVIQQNQSNSSGAQDLTNSQYDGVESNYVDEEGIVDAMQDYEEDEIIHEEEAVLQIISDGNVKKERNGLIRLVKTVDEEGSHTILEFETEKCPSAYTKELTPEIIVNIKDNAVFIPGSSVDVSESTVLRFSDEQTAASFFSAITSSIDV